MMRGRMPLWMRAAPRRLVIPRGRAPARLRAVFVGVPEGRYGIAVFHDIDSDEKLGTNLLGYPTEPFGFGNDAEVRFSRPAFSATAIAVSDAPTRTVVTLK